MSQFDFGTINPNTKSGTDLASDLNSFRDALNSLHKGNTRPTYAAAGTLWLDDSATPWELKLYDGSDDIKLGEIAPSTDQYTPDIDKLLQSLDTNGKRIDFSEGASIASASSCDIWTNSDGNTVHITGTSTINDFATAPRAGAFMWVIFDASLTITHAAASGASIDVPGDANYTTSAGDIAFVYAETTTTYRIIIFPANGEAVVTEVSRDATPKLGGPVDTNSHAINFSEGANVASATSCDIWANDDGNTIHITGTTTIDDFATAPRAGATRWLIFDDAVTITHGAASGASIDIPGAENYTTSTGDIVWVYAETTTTFKIRVFKEDGTALASGGGGGLTAGTTLTQDPVAFDATVTQAHGLGEEPKYVKVYLECTSADLNYSVGDRLYVGPNTVFSSGTANFGFITEIDGTNVTIRTVDFGDIRILNHNTRAPQDINEAKWKLEAIPYV